MGETKNFILKPNQVPKTDKKGDGRQSSNKTAIQQSAKKKGKVQIKTKVGIKMQNAKIQNIPNRRRGTGRTSDRNMSRCGQWQEQTQHKQRQDKECREDTD